MARRCDVHGLAASPDGHCTLCLRDATRTRTQRWAFAIAAASFFGVVAVCAAAVARSAAHAPRASAPLVPELVAEPAKPPVAVPPAHGVDDPYVAAAPTTAAKPQLSELDAARRDVAITIYSAAWCGYCKKAKAFMDARGLAYSERDVDDDAAAAKELRAISPKGSIPAFKVDQETMVGWSQNGLLAAIDRAAKLRLMTKP